MSLILGVNLPDKLFLISDTRLTHITDGKKIYRNNFLKIFSYNEKITVAVAGNAVLANFILQKIRDSRIINNEILYFREKIESFLLKILNDYQTQGGQYTNVVLIFGGYDVSKKKKINSSIFGDFQSRGIVGKKDIIHQSINKKVIEGLMREFSKRGFAQIPKDTEFEIDYPYSSIFSVEINLPNAPEIKDIDCYSLVMYAQKGLTERNIPFDILQELEVNIDFSLKGEELIYRWSTQLVRLVHEVAGNYYLDAVGGNVVTLLLTPHGAVFPTGKIMFRDNKTGITTKVSEVLVREGEFCTIDEHGNITPFEQIINFNKKGNFQL